MPSRPVSGLVAAIALALAAPVAAQDAARAQALADAGDFVAARAELAHPELRADPAALLLAARLSRDGAGAPADPVAAYRDFTLVFMLADPDTRALAADERRQLGRGMTLVQMRTAEGQAIDWLDAGMGKTARKARVDELISILKGCIAASETCDDAVWITFELGPAAAPAAPYLERMMTADPMWIPRIDYAQALTAIGSAAAPAFCRIMLDGREFALEGPWNAQAAAEGLSLLGPAAREALPCLAEAMTAASGPIPDDTARLGETFGTGPDEMILAMRIQMAQAIINTGDPDRTIHDSLVEAGRRTDEVTLHILLSWIMGMAYQELQPAVGIARIVLSDVGSDPGQADQAEWMMLNVLFDLSLWPGFAEQAQPLLPQLRDIERHGPDGFRELAHSLVEAIDAPGYDRKAGATANRRQLRRFRRSFVRKAI